MGAYFGRLLFCYNGQGAILDAVAFGGGASLRCDDEKRLQAEGKGSTKTQRQESTRGGHNSERRAVMDLRQTQ